MKKTLHYSMLFSVIFAFICCGITSCDKLSPDVGQDTPSEDNGIEDSDLLERIQGTWYSHAVGESFEFSVTLTFAGNKVTFIIGKGSDSEIRTGQVYIVGSQVIMAMSDRDDAAILTIMTLTEESMLACLELEVPMVLDFKKIDSILPHTNRALYRFDFRKCESTYPSTY